MQWPEEEAVEEIPSFIRSYPCSKKLLSAKEEIDLCKRAQDGDQSSRDRVIHHNVRLVFRIAHRYKGRAVPMEDLVQEGMIGLMTAVQKFDGTKGYRFSTYATYWIRQAMTRAIERQGRQIRVPAHFWHLERRYGEAHQLLSVQLGREPTEEEISAYLGISRLTARTAGNIPLEPLSLDHLLGIDQDTSLADLIVDEISPDPQQVAIDNDEGSRGRQWMKLLPHRERFVLECRYGFHDGTPWTLAEIGKELGVSREAARQIEDKALRRLRSQIGKEELDDLS